jgi:hypothetical protein
LLIVIVIVTIEIHPNEHAHSGRCWVHDGGHDNQEWPTGSRWIAQQIENIGPRASLARSSRPT